MRATLIFGQMLLASVFTLPGCGKGRIPPMPINPGPPIGRPSPEIEGEDLDGVPFKLSDYRGKVVMLDFWGEFCPPCRAFYPHEKSLVTRYKGRPFVLLGVNNDEDREVALRGVQRSELNWRSWWDSGGRPGPIATAWNLTGWPTVYLIDAKGIVRSYFGQGDFSALDDAIEKLVLEAEGR